MKRNIIALAMGLGLLVPAVAFAGPVVRSGDSVTITQDQTVESDLYAAAGNVTISGAVGGDAYVAGGTITVNAPVEADLVSAGGTIQLHGPVKDDVRVAGGETTIASEVGGDVVVFGGVLHILSTADIKGDVLFFGGEMDIEGPVKGSVFGRAGTVRIDASVGGDVDLRADGGLTLGDRAEILGDVVYTGSKDIVRAQHAVVVGDIQTKEAEKKTSSPIAAMIIWIFSVLFVSLAAFLLFRRPLESLVQTLEHSYGKDGLIGLGVLIGVPFVGLILMVSVLGFLAGAFLLLCYGALLIAGWVVAGVFVGTFFMRLFSKKMTVSVASVALGTCLLQLVTFVPFIGWLIAFAALLVALGAISMRLYRLVAGQ